MQFLTQILAIYFNKKTDFDSKNNYNNGKLTYF